MSQKIGSTSLGRSSPSFALPSAAFMVFRKASIIRRTKRRWRLTVMSFRATSRASVIANAIRPSLVPVEYAWPKLPVWPSNGGHVDDTTNPGAMLATCFSTLCPRSAVFRTSRIHSPTPIRMPGISWRKRRTMSRSRSCIWTGPRRAGSPHRCASRSLHTVFTASPAASDRQMS
jgi:hypothetical protein